MSDPKFGMLVESFMEHAKQQDQSVVDGAIFVFLPKDGGAVDASLFSWVSETGNKKTSEVWHDVYLAMLYALLKTGVDVETLHELVQYAAKNMGTISANLSESPFEDDGSGVVN
ncbi:MAG: hypothetical protein ACYSW8_29475 [Planctomycetota bacterium]|jgi:hypothetical protein